MVMRNVLAVFIGLVSGAIFFWLVEPAILGQRPTPMFDREASIFFVFRLFPLLVVPAVCLIVALLRPASRMRAFKLGAIVSTSLLIPVPVVDEWRTIPTQYGLASSSMEVLREVALLLGFLAFLAAISSAIAAVVSPLIHRVIVGGRV